MIKEAIEHTLPPLPEGAGFANTMPDFPEGTDLGSHYVLPDSMTPDFLHSLPAQVQQTGKFFQAYSVDLLEHPEDMNTYIPIIYQDGDDPNGKRYDIAVVTAARLERTSR